MRPQGLYQEPATIRVGFMKARANGSIKPNISLYAYYKQIYIYI